MSKKKAGPGTQDDEETLSYEAVIERLEGLVEQLESGDLPLEAQIQAFETGMKLVRRGQSLLDAAERKVELLLNEAGETEPFEPAAPAEG